MAATSRNDVSTSSPGAINLTFRYRVAIAFAVLRRPYVWPTVMRLLLESSPPGWWKRPPFVPIPDPAYVRFRMATAYGRGGSPTPADVVGYLQWCAAARLR